LKLRTKLGLAFGVVAAPVAALYGYYQLSHEVVYECTVKEGLKNGAAVVEWKLPPLIGERRSSHAMMLLDGRSWVSYGEQSNDPAQLIARAKTFCTTGQLKAPAP